MSESRDIADIWEKVVVLLEDQRVYTLLMTILSALVLIGTALSNMWGDLDHYYDNAGDVLSGLMPYSEAKFEYPPLSLVFMLIPRVLTWDLESFHYGCAVLTYVFLAIGSYFLVRIADERIGCRWQTHLIMILVVLFGNYFVIARNDVYPTVMAIIAFWLYLKDRHVLAFIMMALAAMTKMYPAIFLIPMLMPLVLKGEWKKGVMCLLAAATVCFIVELPFLITDPSTAFAYLNYHSDRGIQVESVAASFFMIYDLIVPGNLSVVFAYGSDNLSGAGPDALAPFMNTILAIVLISFVAVMLVRIHRLRVSETTGPQVVLISVTMLMLFIAFSKVYSAQYLIWILMLLPLTQMSCFGRTDRMMVLLVTIPFGLFSVFSYIGYNAIGLPELDSVAVFFTSMKNILHILLTIVLLHMCWNETKAVVGDGSVDSILQMSSGADPLTKEQI